MQKEVKDDGEQEDSTPYHGLQIVNSLIVSVNFHLVVPRDEGRFGRRRETVLVGDGTSPHYSLPRRKAEIIGLLPRFSKIVKSDIAVSQLDIDIARSREWSVPLAGRYAEQLVYKLRLLIECP